MTADDNELMGQQDALPEVAPELAPLDPPEVWDEETRGAFGELQKLPEGRRYAETWHKHWKSREGAYTKLGQDFANHRKEYESYRQRFDPISRVLEPHIGTWSRSGISPDMALNQLLSTYQHIQQNPRDGLLELAKSFGVDLNELVHEAPYVDPAVAREIAEVRQQNAQLMQHLQAYGMQQQQGTQHQMIRAIEAFESAKDEKGSPAYPYARDVWDDMRQLISSGVVNVQGGDFETALKAAYERAIWLNEGARERMLKDKAKAEAAAREAEAKKAAEASRKVQGKGGKVDSSRVLNKPGDAVRAAFAELG